MHTSCQEKKKRDRPAFCWICRDSATTPREASSPVTTLQETSWRSRQWCQQHVRATERISLWNDGCSTCLRKWLLPDQITLEPSNGGQCANKIQALTLLFCRFALTPRPNASGDKSKSIVSPVGKFAEFSTTPVYFARLTQPAQHHRSGQPWRTLQHSYTALRHRC
jgi:hypothetical protein